MNKITVEWIPVDVRLPEINEDVESNYILLSFANFSLPSVGRYQEDKDGGGNFYLGDDDEPLIKHQIIVNAWMNLPKCYEED